MDEPLLDRAADLEPGELRTLDAIQLATALEIGQDLGVMVAYDNGLRAAAEAYGLAVTRIATQNAHRHVTDVRNRDRAGRTPGTQHAAL